ncbi:hypothetical protein DAI22_11g198300 [Oryza sativa Japonica Group]|nr:hypothetical protein DAI22_11g198300 [Oryza sativa Japonica Group]
MSAWLCHHLSLSLLSLSLSLFSSFPAAPCLPPGARSPPPPPLPRPRRCRGVPLLPLRSPASRAASASPRPWPPSRSSRSATARSTSRANDAGGTANGAAMSATAPTTNAEMNGHRRPATDDKAATLEKGGGRRGDEGEEKVRRLARGRSLARHRRSAPPTARLPAADPPSALRSAGRSPAARACPLPLHFTLRLTLTDAPTPPSSASSCTASPAPRTSSRCPSSQLSFCCCVAYSWLC